MKLQGRVSTVVSDALEQLLTIGHSNHEPEDFLALVSAHRIEVIADVRSWPRSRHVPWADREHVPELLRTIGCRYVYLGAELGGRPDRDDCYDAAGHVLYGRVARTEGFRRGVDRLKHGLSVRRVAAMCSEENPTDCHRRLLIAKTLLEQGIAVAHVRGDGRLELELGVEPPDGARLFDDEDRWWRSSVSVSHRRRQQTSSAV
jgi:uncharacterized protein (DUF488 family)